MNVTEFEKKININSIIVIKNKKYKIREIVKFRVDDGSSYTKCYLENDFILAGDSSVNSYLLMKPVDQNFSFPYARELIFDNKFFKFLFEAHAIAVEIFGEDTFFKVGEGEKFWDYSGPDGYYLSLGINDIDNHKADHYGLIIKSKDLKIH